MKSNLPSLWPLVRKASNRTVDSLDRRVPEVARDQSNALRILIERNPALEAALPHGG